MTLLALGRVSNLPTVWTNVLAATVLAGGDVFTRRTFALAVAISCLYVGGMFLNDAFDREHDARFRPERPIPSRRISAHTVFLLGFGLLGGGVLILSTDGVKAFLWGLGLAAVIVYYDARHKRDPFSPVVIAFCRTLVYCVVSVAVAGAVTRAAAVGGGVVASYLTGLSYAAKQEHRNALAAMWPLALLFVPFVYLWPILPRFDPAAGVFLIFLLWVIFAVRLLRRGGRSIPLAVVRLLAGIALLDALLMLRVGAPPGVVALAIIGFTVTRALQRWVPAT
jgi:4-hydroxybenzoate polyprenyltransferase